MKKPIALISTDGKTPEQIYEELQKSLRGYQDKMPKPHEDQSTDDTDKEPDA